MHTIKERIKQLRNSFNMNSENQIAEVKKQLKRCKTNKEKFFMLREINTDHRFSEENIRKAYKELGINNPSELLSLKDEEDEDEKD